MDVEWTAVEVHIKAGITQRKSQRMHTPDRVADRPRDGSSVSIMVGLQIVYISPLLLCWPQAHEASVLMLLLANKGSERDIQRGVLWVVGGCRNQRIQTHTYRIYSVSTGPTTKLLFLPE